ncbi:GNAT family N-acetyltransferase [Schumannella sp. 10F1B-5-1]|uniref:GNAT family N-acetyltransferase n=1 Tax=Schumannella sp. 10F1B-5-1 TaxID=2590780 RepID=UPI0011311C25|nr:GNAT family protein [Schumannella sp. 10F1B-5-1]TPW76899.1 GNAT family N-acetyltransferase [Schumannella sp. 10F1B-5-1]
MTATRPAPTVLTGRFVRLEPFDADAHTDGLFAALAKPEVFAGGFGGGPAGLPADRAAFGDWVAGYGNADNARKFVVRLVGGPDADTIVGASTLGDLDEHREETQLGWTGYDPRVWGTQVNPETKLLLLGHAFASGYGRVRIQADSQNERSRAAILKLGATFEGVLRRDRVRADGTFSGTAVHSILIDEWDEVRTGLEQRLARFDAPVALG